MKQRQFLKLLIIGVLVSSFINASAQNVETKIQSVTVYRKGAMVERTGTINLKKGSNTLYLNNLSTELDPNTLRIGINNKSAKILSVKHEIVVVNNETAQAKTSDADKRIAILKDSLSYLLSQNAVLSQEEELIKTNRNIGGQQNGVSTAELKSMSDFYKKELSEISTKKIAINKAVQNHRNEMLRLLQEKENGQKNLQRKDSRIKLVIESDQAISSIPVSMSYLIFSASWEPFYEVRIDQIDQPLDLVYGAHIKQSSTEDWNNVKLTVSTGDPSIGNTAPEFASMFLPTEKHYTPVKKWIPPSSNLVYGIVIDEETKEPLIGVTVVENGTKNGTITDIDGLFQINMEHIPNTLTFSYIGYVPQTIPASEDMQVNMYVDDRVLDEIVVVGYGVQSSIADPYAAPELSPLFSKGSRNKESSDKKEIHYKEPEKKIPLELEDTQTSTEFKIEVPYTIPADDKIYDVSMLTYHIDADYRFRSQPRRSDNVFLLADLTNFSQYPLLKGSAYVYLDNVYQGECEIAPDFAADTLSITVGRDKNIAINRQAVKEFTSKKLIGSTVRVTKCYEITIKNNKRSAVNVEVIDQYPLPKYSDIKVELTDNGGAQVDTEKGKLSWMLNLAPQEKKVIRFSYEVKYPKSYNFSVE